MRSVSILVLALLIMPGASIYAQEGSPAGPVPPQLLKQRRALLLDRVGEGVIALRAARESDRRQENDFFYLTGIETPDAWLLLVARRDAPDQVVLYIPPRNPEEEQWTGARLDVREAARLTGVDDVRTTDRVAADIGAHARPGAVLYVSPSKAAREWCDPLEPSQRTRCLWLFLQPLRGTEAELRDVAPHIAELRLVKDDDEIRRMRRAIDITAEALRTAMQRAKPGIWEYEIQAEIERVFRAGGAERVGFPTIVGSGINGTVLHYDQSRRQTRAGDLVVMDVGAEFGYYVADVTRTIPVDGRFTPRQRSLYDLVLGAQQAAMDSVKPGMTLVRLDRIAREYMRRNSNRLCAPQTCDAYFVHAVGHWLGMEVHDPASVTTPLAPGMVLTIEPGIYLAREALGIRIEDDVLVTATGYELLSRAVPRRADEIEQLMTNAKLPGTD